MMYVIVNRDILLYGKLATLSLRKLFKTKHMMHTVIHILNYFCFNQLSSICVCQDLVMNVHGQGDKVGNGRLVERKNYISMDSINICFCACS